MNSMKYEAKCENCGTTILNVDKKCPYCDGQIAMKLTGLLNDQSVYCPYCGSILGYARITAEIVFNDIEEDMEFYEQYCVHCRHLCDDNTCKLQASSHANYGYPGCKYEPAAQEHVP